MLLAGVRSAFDPLTCAICCAVCCSCLGTCAALHVSEKHCGSSWTFNPGWATVCM